MWKKEKKRVTLKYKRDYHRSGEAFNKEPEYSRHRVTLSIFSTIVLIYVLGGGNLEASKVSIFGGTIEFDNPAVLYAAFVLIFVFSTWRFRILSRSFREASMIEWRFYLIHSPWFEKRKQAALARAEEKITAQPSPFSAQGSPELIADGAFMRIAKYGVVNDQQNRRVTDPKRGDPLALKVKLPLPVYCVGMLRRLPTFASKSQIVTDYVIPNLLWQAAAVAGIWRLVTELLKAGYK